MAIKKGDIVCFKSIYTIGVKDLIIRNTYSKYMLVIDVINYVKPACKVMCANGEVNWVAADRLERANNR